MKILSAQNWDDYQLIDSGDGRRLEKFGKYTLDRPDPEALWKPSLPDTDWTKAEAVFIKSKTDRGTWTKYKNIPEKWEMKYKRLKFWVKLTPFKHTGVFPEQSVQWDWIIENIKAANRPISVLNLFAYSGISSLAAATAGAVVTHVDSSKPSVTWARENRDLSALPESSIRWIVDDAVKFTAREIRRGKTYDGIILDPPVYGHGPNGEVWDFTSHIDGLLENCRQLLSKTPLFVLFNAYAVSHSSLSLKNILEDKMKDYSGTVDCGELTLIEESRKRELSTGIFARWKKV